MQEKADGINLLEIDVDETFQEILVRKSMGRKRRGSWVPL